MKISATIIAIAALALAACNRHGLLPDSGGRPYEVTLAGDTDSVVWRMLTSDVEDLPQPEPMFDVDIIDKEQLKGAALLAHNIVTVDINPELYSRTAVKYERNVYADNQLIVYVHSPSRQQLKRDAQRLASVAQLLGRHETSLAIARLRRHHNPKMEAEVKKMFGIDMLIPSDMKASKRGKDFIWISNDSPTAMTNICIYRSANRDSVMGKNIKGETDKMYMTTATAHTVRFAKGKDGRTADITRGLWEMHGDAMGGPFVSHTTTVGNAGSALTVEAFVYAPSMRKRNLMLETEAALFTVK